MRYIVEVPLCSSSEFDLFLLEQEQMEQMEQIEQMQQMEQMEYRSHESRLPF
jgi:hypothetical protein